MARSRVRYGQTGPYTPLDASDGNIEGANRLAFYATPTGDVTFTFNNCDQGVTFSLLLNMPSPAVNITWPSGVVWPGGFPPALIAGEQGVYNFLRIGDQYYASTAVSATKVVYPEEPTGDIDGSNTVFELLKEPVAGFHMGFLNGIKLTPGSGNDYTISGKVVTMAVPPLVGDRLEFSYVCNGTTVAPSAGQSSAASNPFYLSMVS